MSIPTNDDILNMLPLLVSQIADDLESQTMDIKPWLPNIKDNMKVAVEYSACFSNRDGGVIVFGIEDRVTGRQRAIHGARGYDVDVWKKAIYDNVKPHVNVDIEELSIPEGTGKLLIVRIPKGGSPPYGTVGGLYKRRVGKNCMPMDPVEFMSIQMSTGVVDWSGEISQGITLEDLDPVEIARARGFLKSRNPSSDLLLLPDIGFLKGLEVIRNEGVTNAGLLLFGKQEVIAEYCPQNQVHYVHQTNDTEIHRNDMWKTSLLQVVEKLEGIFSSSVNPEVEITVGLFKLRIPAFPIDVVREALLNALTHRDYTNPGEVFIKHTSHELIVTSPGGFIGGVSLNNILRHGPAPRNRILANAFVKLRLVESAGTGCRRIFSRMLEYGKNLPHYEADSAHVKLRIYDGMFDHSMAQLISKWQSSGKDFGLNELLILKYLKGHRFINSSEAAIILQLNIEETIDVLDGMSNPERGILERRGHTRSATYYLTKSIAKDLIGKAAYSSARGIDTARYQEMVRIYVHDYSCISNRECRQLLGLGDSPSAQVEAARYLKKWSGPEGFLEPSGSGRAAKYILRNS